MPGVQNFPKPYLFHPDSKLDVLYMNLDLLDESYPMVKCILHFEQVDHTSLTDLGKRSDWFPPVVSILVVNSLFTRGALWIHGIKFLV